ncbi:hypothetical protein [Sphingomonas bacterium]|uniref:hypothetical protein n=1 Tax=Sphingomonas bacterium TaxID=1895847 RepID=UPI0015750D2C|nr:hypothetical protein [Sphingomonas bacterium]
MTAEHFDIATDAGRNFLTVSMRGHWTTETVNAYRKAVIAAVSGMLAAGTQRGDLLTLVDARDLNAQSQTVVADYKASMDRDGLVPRRLATLVSSALLKRQVDRIAIPNQRVFTEKTEAMAWLFAPADPE